MWGLRKGWGRRAALIEASLPLYTFLRNAALVLGFFVLCVIVVAQIANATFDLAPFLGLAIPLTIAGFAHVMKWVMQSIVKDYRAAAAKEEVEQQ